jgi:mxaK protein
VVGASRLKRWLWLAAFALFVAGAWQVVRIREALRFNAAVRADRLAAAAELDAPEGDFAAALILQRKGTFEAALHAYGAISSQSEPLNEAVRFNLANSYLRRALDLGESAGGDVVGPLIELAKQEYRQVLRNDSAAWDAKYNLELALSMQPDVGDVEAGAEVMPEHSRHAVATQRKFERLP